MGGNSQPKGKSIYLTYEDSKSRKFWEISLEGTTHTVRFGRIGSTGQRKTKTFDSAAAAELDADKLVRSKERKGYVRQGAVEQAKKSGGQLGHRIEKASIAKALKSLSPGVAALPDKLTTAECKEMFANAPDTFEELLSPLGDEIYFSWSFARMWISHVAMGDDACQSGFNNAKDLHFGDLHVRGNLDLSGNLSVLGNLRVDGVITQDTCEYAVLLVAGDLQTRAMDVRGRTWVGGEFRGDYLQLSRWGFLYAASGVEASLVVRDAFESGIRCNFKARHFVDTTILEEEEGLASLSNILISSAMEDSEEYFDPDVALALAGGSEPFLKSPLAPKSSFARIADEY